ncbi:hypothetical protein AAEU29_12775 [Pseudoalteromonas sp. SSM20]|uniref:hypothetical protein n=1 Tax=Pseudoalteromonas sp. SSM20 TaxID=3139394 RepID=UPI003BA95345
MDLIDLNQQCILLHHYEPLDDPQLMYEKVQLLNRLYDCDGLMIIAPEWGGMLPPVLHNA